MLNDVSPDLFDAFLANSGGRASSSGMQRVPIGTLRSNPTHPNDFVPKALNSYVPNWPILGDEQCFTQMDKRFIHRKPPAMEIAQI